MRLLAASGLPLALAGVLLSAVFAIATLVLLWNSFLDADLSWRGLSCLALAAFFPGHVYYHGLFPVSLCTFMLLAGLRFILNDRFFLAGLACASAAFSYPPGLFSAGAVGLYLLIVEGGPPWRQRLLRLATVSSLAAAGFIGALVIQYVDTGAWNSFFRAQHKYGYGFHSPLTTLGHTARLLLEGGWKGQGFGRLQTMIVAVMMVTLLWTTARARDRNSRDAALASFGAVYWLLPLILGGGLSLYRAEALLVPVTPLARRLRLPTLVLLAVAAVALAFLMGRLFFRSVLV